MFTDFYNQQDSKDGIVRTRYTSKNEFIQQ